MQALTPPSDRKPLRIVRSSSAPSTPALRREADASTIRVQSLPLSRTSALCALKLGIYSCRSWRCSLCRRKRLSQDWKRIRLALTAQLKGFWYVTLTFPRLEGHHWTAWRRAQRAFNRLLRRLVRRFGVKGKLPYLAVWEESEPGRPHLNLVLRSPAISRQGLHAFLRKALIPSGLGQEFYADAVQNPLRLTSYLCKHEQLPYSSPPRFQRVRTSRGFLPRRLNSRPPKSKKMTSKGIPMPHPALEASNAFVMNQIAQAQAAQQQAVVVQIAKSATPPPEESDLMKRLRAILQKSLVGGLAKALKKELPHG